MRSCDRPPWYLSLSMSLIMRMSMRCCGIWPDPQRARGYAQRVGSYATSAPNGVSVRPPSTSRRRGLGHVTEMTGHVPETVGHDAENTGHALPKYAQRGLVQLGRRFQSIPAALAKPRYLATAPLEMFRLRAMRSCARPPWDLGQGDCPMTRQCRHSHKQLIECNQFIGWMICKGLDSSFAPSINPSRKQPCP